MESSPTGPPGVTCFIDGNAMEQWPHLDVGTVVRVADAVVTKAKEVGNPLMGGSGSMVPCQLLECLSPVARVPRPLHRSKELNLS